jgi:hypothetical protein
MLPQTPAVFVLAHCTNPHRAIQELTKKVAELEASLSSLLKGQAIPPAAAAAIIAAMTKMRPASGAGLPLGVAKSRSIGGAISRGGWHPSEGAAASTEGCKAAREAAPAEPKSLATSQQQQQQQQVEVADELESVIKAINEVSNRLKEACMMLMCCSVKVSGCRCLCLSRLLYDASIMPKDSQSTCGCCDVHAEVPAVAHLCSAAGESLRTPA